MTNIGGLFEKIVSVFSTYSIVSDTLDLLLLTFLFYSILKMIRDSRALTFAKGIFVFLVVYGVVLLLNMQASAYLFQTVFDNILLILVVIFAPEEISKDKVFATTEIQKIFENKNIKLILGTEIGIHALSQVTDFNRDLLFKINQVPVILVEINERKDDILPLAEYFLAIEKTRVGKKISGFSENAKNSLVNHYWAGFESELKNAVERAVLLCESDLIGANDLGLGTNITDNTIENIAGDLACTGDEDKTLKTAIDLFKREYIKKLWEQNGNNQTSPEYWYLRKPHYHMTT